MIKGAVSDFIAPTTEDTCQLLSAINSNNGVYLDYDLVLEFMYYYYASAERVRRSIARYMNISFESLSAARIKGLIVSKNLARYFPKTDSGEVSLDAKKVASVLEMPIIDKEVKWIVSEWIKAAGYESAVNQFSKVLEFGRLDERLTCTGHRMLRLEPLWVPQNTGRFAMQNPAIHNFAGIVKDVTTVPEGYVMQAVDSGQIDPRLTFSFKMPDKQIQRLIVLYDDAYYGILHYVLMPEEDIKSGRLDFEKMEITDELKEKRKKLKTHINAVIYNSHEDGGDQIKASLIKRIGNHPMHVKWVNEVTDSLMSGNYLFNTAFGFAVDVRLGSNNSGKYSKASEESKFNHYMRSAINAPIQGTAADLHRLAIDDVKKFLLMRASRSFIMMSVHDAIYVAVHEDDFDAEKDFLSKCTAYYIDGWVPIECDSEIGVHEENPVFKGKRY